MRDINEILNVFICIQKEYQFNQSCYSKSLEKTFRNVMGLTCAVKFEI